MPHRAAGMPRRAAGAPPVEFPVIEGFVLRYGEIFLKGKNRPNFERRLERNLKLLLNKQGEVERAQGRAFVRGVSASEALLKRVSRLFGISSVSPALFVPLSLTAIQEGALRMLKEASPEPRRFKVSARRSNKRFELDSPQLNLRVGEFLAVKSEYPVSIPNPEIEVGIEVGHHDAFIFTRTLPGPGGLPVGSSGKVALLLSGGIDSPVAGYLAMKRGSPIRAIYFHSPPYTGEGARQKVIDLCRRLVPYHGDPISLHVVPFTETQETLRDKAPGDLLVVLYRRQMIRIAEGIARATGALALVTGESVGQVASQTLENLSCIDAACGMLVLRPLCSFDKQEAVTIAQDIGTYEISIQPHDDCCSLFVPKHPKTAARLSEVEAVEARLPLAELKEKALAATERTTIGTEED
jgi:tRNA uracil 4-sulfurtransferase